MSPRRIVSWTVVAAVAVLVAAFLVQEHVSHCDLRISLALATFDFERHEEDHDTLLYESPWAIPLRAFLALGLIVFVGWPIVRAALALTSRARVWRDRAVSAATWGFPIVAFIAPAGERFFELYFWAVPLRLMTWIIFSPLHWFARTSDPPGKNAPPHEAASTRIE
jgi:hypothetical protein